MLCSNLESKGVRLTSKGQVGNGGGNGLKYRGGKVISFKPRVDKVQRGQTSGGLL